MWFFLEYLLCFQYWVTTHDFTASAKRPNMKCIKVKLRIHNQMRLLAHHRGLDTMFGVWLYLRVAHLLSHCYIRQRGSGLQKLMRISFL